MDYGEGFVKSGTVLVISQDKGKRPFTIDHCTEIPSYVQYAYLFQALHHYYLFKNRHTQQDDFYYDSFIKYFYWGHTILVDTQEVVVDDELYSEYMEYWGSPLTEQQLKIAESTLEVSKKKQYKIFLDLAQKGMSCLIKPIGNTTPIQCLPYHICCDISYTILQDEAGNKKIKYGVVAQRRLSRSAKGKMAIDIIQKKLYKQTNGKYCNNIRFFLDTDSVRSLIKRTLPITYTTLAFIDSREKEALFSMDGIQMFCDYIFNKSDIDQITNTVQQVAINQYKELYDLNQINY